MEGTSQDRRKQKLNVFEMPYDLYRNVSHRMGWYMFFMNLGKREDEFKAYKILWHVVLMCNRDLYCSKCKRAYIKRQLKPIKGKNLCPKCKTEVTSRIEIPEDLIREYERYYTSNPIYDAESEEGSEDKNTSSVLSLYQLEPIGFPEMLSPKANKQISIRGFIDANDTFIGLVDHVEWSQLLNMTLAKLEPVAADINLLIMNRLAEENVRPPDWLLSSTALTGMSSEKAEQDFNFGNEDETEDKESGIEFPD